MCTRTRLTVGPHAPTHRDTQQSLFGSAFASPAVLDVVLTDSTGGRTQETITREGQPPRSAYVFCNGEDITGDVKIAVHPGKRLEHAGIKAEIKGFAGG